MEVMRYTNGWMWAAMLLLISFVACKKEVEPGPESPLTFVEPERPPGFPAMEVPSYNRLSEEGIALGRKLYYDPLLAKGGTFEGMRCASCHEQEHGFGVFRQAGIVPPLPHVNLGWSRHFLWDGSKSGSLEEVMLFEVKDFFGANPAHFDNHPEYKKDFEKLFGQGPVTHEKLAYALAQFFRTMNSANSGFDKWIQGGDPPSARVLQGYELFFSEKGDCFHCHSGPLFHDNQFHNIGLDSTFAGRNKGREQVTGNPAHRGQFKTPTLRNVAMRGPYMHDGRFQSLRELVEHYNSGVKPSPTLDPIMTKDNKLNGLNLTEQEINALIAFLEFLTDDDFLTHPKLSDPH